MAIFQFSLKYATPARRALSVLTLLVLFILIKLELYNHIDLIQYWTYPQQYCRKTTRESSTYICVGSS